MNEEDGMGSDTYCTPNAQESICQGVLVLVMARQEVLVLAMRPSYRDGHGMTYLLLGLYVWPLVGADWGEVWV